MLKRMGGPPATGAGAERVRVLLAVAALPVLAAYAAIAAVFAVVAALATTASFEPGEVLLAAFPGWLAAYQVPITIDGQPLGLLPLGLSIGVAVLVARSAAGAAERLHCRTPHQAVAVIGTIAGAHAVVGCSIAVASSGALATADPLAAFCLPGIFAAVAACAGLARRSGLLDAVRPYTDAAAVAGLRAGLLGLAGLVTCGAAVLAAASVLHAGTMRALFEAGAPGFGSGFGMLLLSVAYAPNAVLAAVGFTSGPGFSFGPVHVSPHAFTGGDVPAVPLLAGLPHAQAGWWPVLFVLPAAVGVLVGWTLRRSSPDRYDRLRSAGVAGAVVGFSCVVLGSLAGGRTGAGAGLVLPLGWLSVAAFCWIAVPAALVSWFAGGKPAPPEPDPEAQVDGELREGEPEPEGQVDGDLPASELAEQEENPEAKLAEGHFVDEVPSTEPPEGEPASEAQVDGDLPEPEPEPEPKPEPEKQPEEEAAQEPAG